MQQVDPSTTRSFGGTGMMWCLHAGILTKWAASLMASVRRDRHAMKGFVMMSKNTTARKGANKVIRLTPYAIASVYLKHSLIQCFAIFKGLLKRKKNQDMTGSGLKLWVLLLIGNLNHNHGQVLFPSSNLRPTHNTRVKQTAGLNISRATPHTIIVTKTIIITIAVTMLNPNNQKKNALLL